MASRPKQESGVMKEKRGKSPSNSRHTIDPAHRTRTSPHPPPADADHQKPNATNIPNYLRPTASSRPDASKSSSTPKKPSLNITVESTAQKANIHRRRSLDNKPPSTSQLFKSQPTSSDSKPNSTHHSPTSNIVKPKPPSAFTKPPPEKVAKAFSKDVGKSKPSYSRPVKTIKKNIPNSTADNSTAATKKQKSAGGNASATKSRHTIDKEAKQEPVQDGDHKSLVAEYEDEDTGTNPVEDRDHHLDDAQHNEGEGDHPSEDIEDSDEDVKKLPDPFMACEEQKGATTPVSEEPNKADAAAKEKEDIEPEELHIDKPQIEDRVEGHDKHKNAHENHHHHQQKESFESESMDVIENVEKWKSEETEHPIENAGEREKVDGEGHTENKSDHVTREDEVELEEKKEKTEVKEEEAEVNKDEVEVKEENPEVKEETTEAKVQNPEVKDQKTYIEERVTDMKEDKAEVEEEISEVKEEKTEVKEEPEKKEKQKSEQFEEKPNAKEEKQLNEGVKEEKSKVKGEDLMHKKTIWRTTSGHLGNNKDDNSSDSNSNAYNNVIEETASKLKEQRKNKVLALVGAFETIISLEDPDSETPRGN